MVRGGMRAGVPGLVRHTRRRRCAAADSLSSQGTDLSSPVRPLPRTRTAHPSRLIIMDERMIDWGCVGSSCGPQAPRGLPAWPAGQLVQLPEPRGRAGAEHVAHGAHSGPAEPRSVAAQQRADDVRPDGGRCGPADPGRGPRALPPRGSQPGWQGGHGRRPPLPGVPAVPRGRGHCTRPLRHSPPQLARGRRRGPCKTPTGTEQSVFPR